MIAYASRKLRPLEANYLTHDLDLGVVVFALNIFAALLVQGLVYHLHAP